MLRPRGNADNILHRGGSQKSTAIMLTRIYLFLHRSFRGVQSQPLGLLVQLHALLFWGSSAVRDHAGGATSSTFIQRHRCSACFNHLVNGTADKNRDGEKDRKERSTLFLYSKGSIKCGRH